MLKRDKLAIIRCSHCHGEFDEAIMEEEQIDGERYYFCCNGCSGVFHLLRNQGLDSFYDKLGSKSITPPKELHEDLSKFDTEGFANKYISKQNGLSTVSLVIEGIHCSACVWLNERILHEQKGVIEASINYSTNKAKVTFDPNIIALSKIIQIIRSIGYDAYAYDPKVAEDRANTQKRDYYSRLLVAVFTSMNIMWIAIADYAGYFTGMSKDHQTILHIAEFILASITLFYTGYVFYKGAYYGLKNRYINMDLLVATGASLAYGYSLYATIIGLDKVYFDSVNMIITFVFVGKYLEVLSKKKAVDVMDSLSATLPTEVLVVQDGQKILTPVEKVAVGDTIEVKAGEKIVIDGILLSSDATLDESSLSGESIPVVKTKDEEILSGSINVDSVIRYKASKEYASSTLHTIITLLEDSMSKKPDIEKLANSISGYFSSAILLIAVMSFAYWINVSSFENAIMISIAVIVIACPCALGLATPVATLIGLSYGARMGIIFKEASFLETIAKSDLLVLDKTGTITEGKPKVIQAHTFLPYDLSLLHAFVSHSTHPISKGVATYCQDNKDSKVAIENVQSIQAKGIAANYQGVKLLGGNAEFMEQNEIKVESLQSGHSLFYYAVDGALVAIFELSDVAKKGAKEAIAQIQDLGIEVVMLTGDRASVAKKIAQEVGIKEYKDSLLPIDKAEYVKQMHDHGHIVVMAGDGINDTLALSYSSVAIAMGSGADIAVSASDVVLLDDSMGALKDAIKLSHRTFAFVKQNLLISLIYNLTTIPLAVMGFVIPLIAALSMSLSSLLVVGNSFRIKNIKLGVDR
jgi:Cu+-exporting ATPase